MTFGQAMFLAVLQGISELFPVSSLGHTVLIPALLHWRIDRADPTFLAFVVVLHLGTALALVAFYFDEWRAIVAAFVTSVIRGQLSGMPDERVAWLLVAGSVPVGLLGVLFESKVKALFAAPLAVAAFLIVNALIMFAGEHLRRAQLASGMKPKRLQALNWKGGAIVGLAQSLALLPGISRSGSSIVAGLLLDLSHEDAARYSFLLATPAILAASLLEVPKLFARDVHLVLVESIVGGIVAGIAAYLSVAFLTRYFQANDLRPFGWYCLIFGAFCLALFSTKVFG